MIAIAGQNSNPYTGAYNSVVMDYNFWLAVVGILLTVFFGVLGVRAVTKKIQSSSQKQKVGKGSVGIQSGRDTKIGPEK